MSAIYFEYDETPGLISVVIPTYRGERFIREALESIGAQTEQSWEVIVVEDGSRDATERIVRDFAASHLQHRVCYRRNEGNLGPSAARNVAFRQARGEFIAFLDSDDRWYPDYLAVMREKLETTGKDIAYCSVIMIEDQSDLLIGVWGPEARELTEFPHGLLFRNFITPSATVVRRSVLADVGLWNTQFRYCEDLEYWLRCVAAKKSFQYVGGVHCLYRRNHAEAATTKMCMTQEAHAHIAEGFLQLPGTREKLCRKYVARAYVRAAEFHKKANPVRDPSADRSRAPKLLWRAWRVRRQHIDYLWMAFKLTVSNAFRWSRTPSKTTSPSTASETVSAESRVAA
jgi:glycosyltransferase involved in cell wall biosynthesis